MATIKESTYTCSKCAAVQTITYFADDQVLPVTCCVKCRSGFGVELGAMLANHVGMFPGKASFVRA